MSLEALSRGAAEAVAVERARAAAELIRRNFAALEVEPGAWRLIVAPASTALGRLAEEGARFSVVWCDPPFASWAEGAAALTRARELGLLTGDAVAVIETPGGGDAEVEGFERIRKLRGAVLLRPAGAAGASALY